MIERVINTIVSGNKNSKINKQLVSLVQQRATVVTNNPLV